MDSESFTRPRLLRHVVACLVEMGSKRGLSIKQILEKVKMALTNTTCTVMRGQPSTVSLIRRALRYGMNAGIIRYCNGKFKLAIDKSKAQYIFTRKFDLSDYLDRLTAQYKRKLQKRGNLQSSPEKTPTKSSYPDDPDRDYGTKTKGAKSRKRNLQSNPTTKQPIKKRGRPPGRKKRQRKTTKSRRRKKVDDENNKEKENKGRRRRKKKDTVEKTDSDEDQNELLQEQREKILRALLAEKKKKENKTPSKKAVNKKSKQSQENVPNKSNENNPEKTDENKEEATNSNVDPRVHKMIENDLEAVRPTAKNKVLDKKTLSHGPTLEDFSD